MTDMETLLREIKAEVVAMRTELVLVKFAVEKMERQVEELHEKIIVPEQGHRGGQYYGF